MVYECYLHGFTVLAIAMASIIYGFQRIICMAMYRLNVCLYVSVSAMTSHTFSSIFYHNSTYIRIRTLFIQSNNILCISQLLARLSKCQIPEILAFHETNVLNSFIFILFCFFLLLLTKFQAQPKCQQQKKIVRKHTNLWLCFEL